LKIFDIYGKLNFVLHNVNTYKHHYSFTIINLKNTGATMLKIAICDDQKKNLKLVEQLLYRNYTLVQVTTYDNPSDLLSDFFEHRVDFHLLISDIRMQKSGIELAKELLKFKPDLPIIFMSGYMQYVEEIFQIHPSYFLLKPVTEERLKTAISRALAPQNIGSYHVTLQSGSKHIHVDLNSIQYVESHKRLLVFNGLCNKETLYMKMNDWILEAPDFFVRIHQSYCVNIYYIESFSEKGVVLRNNITLPVSQKRYRETKDKILRFINSSIELGS
jgi:two-component system, LytTR family, response regulator LytT